VEASSSPCAPVDARNWGRGGLKRRRNESKQPAAKENGGGGAPAVVSSKEGVGKLQCTVGKLDMGSIGVEEGRGGVCGRTNLNYTDSSMQVLSLKGSHRTSNGVTSWPVG
jgi:hypothetical protein